MSNSIKQRRARSIVIRNRYAHVGHALGACLGGGVLCPACQIIRDSLRAVFAQASNKH